VVVGDAVVLADEPLVALVAELVGALVGDIVE